jgi:hypothetical protein
LLGSTTRRTAAFSSTGRHPENAANWAKHHRVIPEQATEWAALTKQYADASLCVAGDLNMNLGGRYCYGTKQGVSLLEHGFSAAKLVCVTRTEMVPEGKLDKPNIDHICLAESWAARTRVIAAWPGTTAGGVRLSDHSGLVVQVDAPTA